MAGIDDWHLIENEYDEPAPVTFRVEPLCSDGGTAEGGGAEEWNLLETNTGISSKSSKSVTKEETESESHRKESMGLRLTASMMIIPDNRPTMERVTHLKTLMEAAVIQDRRSVSAKKSFRDLNHSSRYITRRKC